jgi:CBS domain containing-hemolysin-like protein
MWVEEINETMDLALPTDESYETIGGLVIDRLGHLPQHPGEKVDIDNGRLTLLVMQMHGRRIVKVKIVNHAAHADSRNTAGESTSQEKK